MLINAGPESKLEKRHVHYSSAGMVIIKDLNLKFIIYFSAAVGNWNVCL